VPRHAAQGGVFTQPTLTWIGEDRSTTPEIASPVALIDQRLDAAFARHGARGDVHVHAHGVADTPEALGRIVGDEIGWQMLTRSR
jgi:hypothetical protein